MVNFDPKYRIERILDIILPSIQKSPADKETRLNWLENYRLKANDLNAQTGYIYADLEQCFMDARHTVEARL